MRLGAPRHRGVRHTAVRVIRLEHGHVPAVVGQIARQLAGHVEDTRTTTCTMPLGSRQDLSGLLQCSASTMDDQFVAIDTHSFEISRRTRAAHGKEGPITEWRPETKTPPPVVGYAATPF